MLKLTSPLLNIFRKVKHNLLDYHRKINWFVFSFICCFTIGAWLDLNSIWCELPIMVNSLPEKWKLPSILTASTQIAQIGPLIFVIGKRFAPKIFTFVNTIYFILGIGIISCILLSFFWAKTAFIFGSEYSIGLIVLNFFLALLDGTSSVTFMPYIGLNFVKEYMIPNYIGESLANLVPSILSLAQGLGGDPGCSNLTDPTTNQTTLTPNEIKPTYSVSIYFLLIFGLLAISTIAFSLLNFSKVARNESKKSQLIKDNANEEKKSKTDSEVSIQSETTSDQQSSKFFVATYFNIDYFWEKFLCIVYTFFLSFFFYGLLPGLQSYSTLPYGNQTFNLSVNLGFLFIPLSVILSIWSYQVSMIRISIEFFIATAFSVYIIVISCLSPCPPLVESGFGSFLSVLSWIISQSLYMRIRCLIAARLERFGNKILITVGFFTQVGQVFGGILVFILVNIYNLFISKPDCVDDYHLYCK